MTASDHNKVIGILLMVHGGLQALVILAMCILYAVVGSAMFVAGEEPEAQFIGVAFIAVVAMIAIVASVVILPQLLGGYLMLRRAQSGRGWGIAASIMSCLSFPFGTAIGVYGLWFLFGETGSQIYLAPAERPAFRRQPEPNSWAD